jgi:hypothetical protein
VLLFGQCEQIKQDSKSPKYLFITYFIQVRYYSLFVIIQLMQSVTIGPK